MGYASGKAEIGPQVPFFKSDSGACTAPPFVEYEHECSRTPTAGSAAAAAAAAAAARLVLAGLLRTLVYTVYGALLLRAQWSPVSGP